MHFGHGVMLAPNTPVANDPYATSGSKVDLRSKAARRLGTLLLIMEI